MNGSKIRQVMDDYVCAGVHNGAGSSPRGLHESVERFCVDLLMGARTGGASQMMRGSPSHESGSWCMIGLATSEERSLGMAARSILSSGSRTRFWIMRMRSRVQALFGMGLLILTVLCGVGGVRIFIKCLPRYSRKAYVGCALC